MRIKIDHRPWGVFEQFTENEKTTVKILTIKKGQETSLQTHDGRKEFWRVLEGIPIVVVGEDIKRAVPGEDIQVDPKVKHQIKAPDSDVKILEISFGEFNENDIVRLEDNYGRT